MNSCLKNPHAKETKQALLAVKSSQAGGSEGVVGTWTFNEEVIRKALAKMLIMDELPFRFVEGRGFKHFVENACPRFKIPSRKTVRRDIWGVFKDDKAELKKVFKENSRGISITTDTWTSIQRINYMCITAHWIDNDWRLNKKVISFVPIFSHKGEEIAKALEKCLVDWGIKDIFSVTVDNASSNDVALGFLKKKLVSWGCSSLKVEYLHMRCIAHILNLVVQDGLRIADTSVKRIRDCVRWVRNSPGRIAKFQELKDLLSIECNKSLCLDVPTRWNSTYLMLDVALQYQKVFEAYESSDSSFSSDLGDSMPSYLDWLSVKGLVPLLQSFYDMTVRISGSLYVTSNTFLSEISDLSVVLDEIMQRDDESGKQMMIRMKEKFRKYWGDPDKMNFIIFFANILDPRDKVEYMGVQLNQLFGEQQGQLLFQKVKSSLTALFEDYVTAYSGSSSSKPPLPVPVQSENIPTSKTQSRLKSQLKKQKAESGLAIKKSELDVYLSEGIVDDDNDNEGFDILRWWKINSDRFPILSKMAQNMLAVPISTVASESTFSTGGRVLDCFRSSLTPRIVEALICTQDWLRGPADPLEVEENLEDLEKLEQELITQPTHGRGGSSSTNPTKSTIVVEDLSES